MRPATARRAPADANADRSSRSPNACRARSTTSAIQIAGHGTPFGTHTHTRAQSEAKRLIIIFPVFAAFHLQRVQFERNQRQLVRSRKRQMPVQGELCRRLLRALRRRILWTGLPAVRMRPNRFAGQRLQRSNRPMRVQCGIRRHPLQRLQGRLLQLPIVSM